MAPFPIEATVGIKAAARYLFLFAASAIFINVDMMNAEGMIDEKQISQKEVSQALADPSWVVVDTRSSDAFNGWALQGEARGGHIPGAVDFPADWLDIQVENRSDQLKSILQTKGIDPADHVVLYSTEESERLRVAEFLSTLGYTNVYLFDLRLWIDSQRPLQQYPQYQRLVPPSIVKKLLDGHFPATFEKTKRIKFVEVSWGGPEVSYNKGHVPSSIHVNTDHFEPPPSWYLGDAEVLSQFAKDYGFQANDTVILSGADVTASYRLCVVLMYMGVADVRVLNGGLEAWKRAGYSLETIPHPPQHTLTFGARIPQRPKWIINTETVKSQLSPAKPFVLIDTRTWAEYQGETTGYSYHMHKGRIPGSVYGQGKFQGSNSLSPYRNIDQTMRNFDEIQSVWRQSGIDTQKHLCFMCGGGWRAAEVFTFAQVGGVKECSLYSDGWIGWSNDPANPVQTGPQEQAK